MYEPDENSIPVFHEETLNKLGLKQMYVNVRIKAQLKILRGAYRWLQVLLERRTGMTQD